MYPFQKIQQAQNSVSQFENQFHQVSGLFHINVSSATLPQSQNLESLLLSRNAANVGSVTGHTRASTAWSCRRMLPRLKFAT